MGNCFFFSSRRRHTRSDRDWSSDVCSSDLELPLRKQLANKLPAGLLDLLRIPGLGPKRVKLLYKKLKVKSAADLAAALDKGRVQKLKGFGPKMEEKMRAGIGQAQVGDRRMLLNET